MNDPLKPLLARWNIEIYCKVPLARRVDNVRREMRRRLRSEPKGKGNRAWKRVAALDRQPGVLIWPYYAL